jgi:hypothetical protein
MIQTVALIMKVLRKNSTCNASTLGSPMFVPDKSTSASFLDE